MENILTEVTPINEADVLKIIGAGVFKTVYAKEASIRKMFNLSQVQVRRVCQLYDIEIIGLGIQRTPNTISLPKFYLAMQNYPKDLAAANKLKEIA